jgi:hypothetical protein
MPSHFRLSSRWLVYLHLIKSFFNGNIIYDLHLPDLCPFIQEHNYGVKQGIQVFIWLAYLSNHNT